MVAYKSLRILSTLHTACCAIVDLPGGRANAWHVVVGVVETHEVISGLEDSQPLRVEAQLQLVTLGGNVKHLQVRCVTVYDVFETVLLHPNCVYLYFTY